MTEEHIRQGEAPLHDLDTARILLKCLQAILLHKCNVPCTQGAVYSRRKTAT